MTKDLSNFKGPHQEQLLLTYGARPEEAQAAMVLVHGRGASAESILTLADEFDQPGFHYLAPQAARESWYPNSFLAPMESNEPGLSSGLQAIGDALARLKNEGVPAERTMLLGFSQGACLALEYAFRNPQRYGGVVALSGALITPPEPLLKTYASETPTRQKVDGAFAATPMFLGCSDRDAHIPLERLTPSAELLRKLGGNVALKIYPNMPHTVVPDEIEFVREMMNALLAEKHR